MNETRQPSEYMEYVLYFWIQMAREKDFEYSNSMRVGVTLSLKELEYLYDCVEHCENMRGDNNAKIH